MVYHLVNPETTIANLLLNAIRWLPKCSTALDIASMTILVIIDELSHASLGKARSPCQRITEVEIGRFLSWQETISPDFRLGGKARSCHGFPALSSLGHEKKKKNADVPLVVWKTRLMRSRLDRKTVLANRRTYSVLYVRCIIFHPGYFAVEEATDNLRWS